VVSAHLKKYYSQIDVKLDNFPGTDEITKKNIETTT